MDKALTGKTERAAAKAALHLVDNLYRKVL